MKHKNILLLILAGTLAMSAPAQEKEPLILGADISWSTELRDAGYIFVDSQGNDCSCVELVKGVGISAVRLRVWVDPEHGYNGLDDLLVKAREVHEQGLDLMVDFHFSDTWADPEHQTVPAAWSGHNLMQLCNDVSNHIQDVLGALKAEGITPRWLQIGNETNDGLLWETGRASTKPANNNYRTILSRAYDAAKKVCPDTKVIVHLSSAQDQSLHDWNLNLLDSKKYDLIGMSLYPTGDDDIEKAAANIRHQWEARGKETIIVEVGVKINNPSSAKLMRTCLDLLRNSTDSHCLGVFYWEPESFLGWNGGYDKGAAQLSGKRIKLGPIMNAFKDMAATTAIHDLQLHDPQLHPGASNPHQLNATPFTLSGLPATPTHAGILIHNGRKHIRSCN